jgi:hypothetical protein
MSLTRSLITQQHRPILDQLLVRLVRQGQVQPISTTTIPQNCLFDEFRRTYDMAYDLQFEGLQHLPPQSATGTL